MQKTFYASQWNTSTYFLLPSIPIFLHGKAVKYYVYKNVSALLYTSAFFLTLCVRLAELSTIFKKMTYLKKKEKNRYEYALSR